MNATLNGEAPPKEEIPRELVVKELLLFAKTKHCGESLVQLGLLDDRGEPYELTVEKGWERGGAETFVIYFSLETSFRAKKKFVIKACAPFALRPIHEIFNTWLSRRALLSASGIETPKLYAVGDCVVLEEHIPFTFVKVLAEATSRASLLRKLGIYLGTIAKLRFVPIDIVHDLRSRGDDVVLVDFGEDLGSQSATEPTTENEIQKTLHYLRSKVALDSEEVSSFREAFLTALSHSL